MKDLKKLNKIKCFILDMDGTFYLGDHLLPGAKELLQLFKELNISYLFLTNNSSRHTEQYVAKLNHLGVNVTKKEVFTSGEATALYLQMQSPNAKLYVVGTKALKDEFRSHGFHFSNKKPDYLVLGFDTTLTYAKLWKLCDFVKAGVPYIATHPDINCPIEGGYMPDTGAMIAFVETSTGHKPDVIIGKPNLPIIEALSKRVGLPIDQLAMVGDRLYTDIALGQYGVTTILVLSGETQLEDLADSRIQPDYILKDLADLVGLLKSS